MPKRPSPRSTRVLAQRAGRQAAARLSGARPGRPGDRRARLDQHRDHRAGRRHQCRRGPAAGAATSPTPRSSRSSPGSPTPSSRSIARFYQNVKTKPGWDQVRAVAAEQGLPRAQPAVGLDRRAAVGQPPDRAAAGCCATFYPTQAGIDLRADTRAFYALFYGVDADDAQLDRLLGGAGPTDAPRSAVVLIALAVILLAALLLAQRARSLSAARRATSRGDRRAGCSAPRTPGPIDTVLFQIRLPRVLAAAAGRRGAGGRRRELPDAVPQSAGVAGHPRRLGRRGLRRGARHPAVAAGARHPGARLRRPASPPSPLVYALARALRSQNEILVLVLAGIVVGALAGAGISLVKILADPYDQLPAITFWLLGSLPASRSSDVQVVAPLVILGLVPLVPAALAHRRAVAGRRRGARRWASTCRGCAAW